MADGEDLDLGRELMELLPGDPYQQLDLARKITSMAVASRVSKLESEVANLFQKLQEKENLILRLQQRIRESEFAITEASSRITAALDEQAILVTENKSLSANVKRLSQNVDRLEAFKKTLAQSLQEEEAEIQSYQQVRDHGDEPLVQHQNINPRRVSYSNKYRGSDRGMRSFERAENSQRLSGYAGEEPSTATHGHVGQVPRMDAKEIFRQARSRLSSDKFSAFMSNVKELNVHRQTREETLGNVEEIFGRENMDLYVLFDGLLSRHHPS